MTGHRNGRGDGLGQGRRKLGGVESLDEKELADLKKNYRLLDPIDLLIRKIALHQARKPLPKLRKKKPRFTPKRIIIESVEFVRNDYSIWPAPSIEGSFTMGEPLQTWNCKDRDRPFPGAERGVKARIGG